MVQWTLKYGVLIIGIFIGIAHLKIGAKSLFVFRNNETIWAWIFVVSGPLSTLPAVIVCFFWPRIGGIWLVSGSLVSLIAGGVLGLQSGDFVWYFTWSFIRYTAPMLLLGLATLLRYNFKQVQN